MPTDRRLAAIMFTDIVGYTSLMGENEQKAFETLEANRNIHFTATKNFRGKIVKELGDGMLTVFENGTEAVLCALEIQKEAQKKNIALRIGIHEGEVVFENSDVFGDGVNIASRIQSEAATGGICISDSVFRIIKNKKGFRAESIGKKHLKNVKDPISLYQLKNEGIRYNSFRANHKSSWYKIFLVGVLSMIAGYLLHMLINHDKNSGVAASLSIMVPAENPVDMIGVTPFRYGQKAIAISPNGQTLVYVGKTDSSTMLFLRNMNSFETRPLPGTNGAFYPFFSPDGNWVAYFTNSHLKKVNINGGEPLNLCPVTHPYGGTWGKNEFIFFSNKEGDALFKVHFTGGKDSEVLRNQDGIFWPFMMPDGISIIFNGGFTAGSAYHYSLSKKELTKVPIYGSNLSYVNTGHIIYALKGRLMVIPFNSNNLSTKDNPLPLIDNVRTEDGHNCAQYDISSNGDLVYLSGVSTGKGKLTFVNHDGKISHNLPLPADHYGQFYLSPDNSKVLFELYENISYNNIKTKIYEIATNSTLNLVNQTIAQSSRWATNDIVFFQSVSDSLTYLKEYNKTDMQVFMKNNSERIFQPGTVSSNGDFMVLYSFEKNEQLDLWSVNLRDTADLRRLTDTPSATEYGISIAPDNRFIAYTSEESGQYEIYVIPYPPDGRKWQVSNNGGLEPKWSPDGEKLYYRSINMKNMMSVPVRLDPEFEKEEAKILWEGDFLDVPGFSYDITNDGQYFLMKKSVVEENTTTQINIITGFFEELKRKSAE